MTVRVNAHHIICPGCQEKVFIDELVGGHCPLCGCVMDDEEVEGEFEEAMERSDIAWFVFHYHVFKKLSEMGAAPLRIMQLLTKIEELCDCELLPEERLEFTVEASMKGLERILPKRCSECGRIFIRNAKKMIVADLNRSEFRKRYLCSGCQRDHQ